MLGPVATPQSPPTLRVVVVVAPADRLVVDGDAATSLEALAKDPAVMVFDDRVHVLVHTTPYAAACSVPV